MAPASIDMMAMGVVVTAWLKIVAYYGFVGSRSNCRCDCHSKECGGIDRGEELRCL